MTRRFRGHRAGPTACAVTALLIITGCSAGAGAEPPPSPSVSSPAPTSSAEHEPTPSPVPRDPVESTPSPTAEDEPEPVGMPRSEPAALSIPAIGVESPEVMELGLQDSGQIEVPPYNYGSPPGWYVYSPTPGEIGPSVILGHRNGLEGGPGIFADLPEMAVGDSIEVTREDGSVASFTVYRTDQVDKGEGFPTLQVYGNTPEAELRLLTCDGLNRETGLMEANFVVYARLER